MTVLIGIVSNRDHKPAFTASLLDLAMYSSQNGIQIKFEIKTGHSSLPHGRRKVVEKALNEGHEHVFMADDDMKFRYDILQILLSRKLPVVGANAVFKATNGPIFTACNFDGTPCESRGKSGVEEVQALGTGLLLLETAVFKTIPKPYFEMLCEDDRDIPEDRYLCKKLREAGHKIYVDHDVSQHVGHVGDFIYTLNSFN